MRLAWGVRAWGVLERGMGMIGGAVVLAALVAGPYIASQTMPKGAGDGAAEPERPRDPDRVELVESWVSEGFSELAEVVAKSPGEPTWESVRRLMDEGGWTKLRYAVRKRWTMTDRHINEITYVRRPYEEQSYFEEFLLVLRNGPIDADCDPPLLLWSRSNGPPSTAPGEAYAPH